MKNFKMLPFVILLFLINCATIDVDHVEDPANQLTIDSLKFQMGVEPTEYRVDLIRKMEITTETKTDEEGDTETRTKESKKDYSPLGFYINDYLFFDLNYNLGFDVYKYFSDRCESDFIIVHDPVCIFKLGSKLEKKGARIQVNSNFLSLHRKTITPVSNNKYIVEDGIFDWKSEIHVTDNKLSYVPFQFLKSITSQRIIRENDEYIVPVLFWKQRIRKTRPDAIQLQNNLSVELMDNAVNFHQPFLFGFGEH